MSEALEVGEVISEVYVLFRGHCLTIIINILQITLLFSFVILFQCAVFRRKQWMSCRCWCEYRDCKKLYLQLNLVKILGSVFAAL